MNNVGIYLWLWIIVANAAAILALSAVGGSTSAMGRREPPRTLPM